VGFRVVAFNTTAKAVAFANVGDELWYQVNLDDGRTGWAISDVVRVAPPADDAELEQLPEATEVPPTPVVVAPTRQPLPTVAPTAAPTLTPTTGPTSTATPTATPGPTLTPFPTLTPDIPTITPIP
jgi:hypothetical protein